MARLKVTQVTKDQLVELYNTGLSHGKIATKLGISKGVAAGRIKRMIDRGELKKFVKTIVTHPVPRQAQPGKETKVAHTSRRYTFKSRPFGYREPSKNELRQMLTQALENSK